ncbi:penicillin-binding protein [Planobispora rosea]|uniref:Penicillin-binding protein n=2 Tax=Planobispora rosea TaxID=35762 RepID=A0A8J3WBA9_PLARO|nr:penicillin-binding protein [Planobispora rosea]GIH81661.1 penicillin-binding protein [Planobispora rosea]
MASGAVLAAGVFGMVAVAYANTPVPTVPKADVNDRESIIYYRDGKTEIARIGTKRVPVTIDKIPEHVQDAVIAAENRSFREDGGIDFSGMARSVWSTVSGTQVQGASTITQQYVRNYYEGISKDVSIQRKVKEIFVAVKVSRELDKSEILTRYLNTIYFGDGAYGIQAAATTFFGKNVWQLTVPEAAYLAGRIQNPSRFDALEKAKNFAATKERYGYVLGGMATMNSAAYGKYTSAPFEELKFKKSKSKEIYRGLRGYMLNIVLRELESRHITEEELETEGLKVVTTFDRDMMLAAKKVVNAKTKGLDPTIHATVASVDPKNGRVLAFYSGDDFIESSVNRAFDTTKQAASAFKPYVLAAWLEAGHSLNSYVDGKSPIKMPGTTPIQNSGNQSFGAIDMVRAMASSVNTVFVQMGDVVTLEEVAKVAKAAGVGEQAKINPSYRGMNGVDYAVEEQKYQVTIGSASVTAVEQAAGYSIFANEGKHVPWHTVKEVKQIKDGLVLLPELRPERQVISPDSAADATVAMQAVVKTGTGTAANLGTRPVAGKTGTNNGYKDAWFVGYTPQLVTAVGMSKDVPYTPDGKRRVKVDKYGLPKNDKAEVIWKEEEMPAFIGGGGTPTQIWHDYMAIVTAKDEVVQFPPKAGVGIPKNLATPKPSPSPTPRDPFGDDTENPTFEWPDDEGDDNGGGGEPQDCLPWDGSCDNRDGGGVGEGTEGDVGNSRGTAVTPTLTPTPTPAPTPSGRRP